MSGCSTNKRVRGTSIGSTAHKAKPPHAAKADSSDATEGDVPLQAVAHYATGLMFDLSGQSDLAGNEYTQAALSDPTYEPVVIEAARRQLRDRKPEKAVEILSKATASPDAPGALYAWLGLACNQAGQNEAAIRANRVAIKKLPRSLPAYQNLSQIYFQTKRTNDAIHVLEEAANQSSTDPAYLIDLSEIYVRCSRLQNVKADAIKAKALQLLDRAGKLNPTNPGIMQKLAEGYAQLGQMNKAEELYLQILKKFPQMLVMRGKLADLYLSNGKRDKAAEQLEAIAQEEPTNPRTQAFLGALQLEENKIDAAVQHFERALLLSPDLEQVYYELAGVKIINQKKPEEGLALLEKARVRFKPNFALDYYTGLAYSQMKKYSDAVKYYTSAELLAKTDQPARLTHQFYYQIGSACERNDDIEQAEKHFQKSLELSPDFPDAMNYLGYMWADRGIKLDRARALIERAVELEPNNAAFLDSFGWVLFKLNQPKEALTYILRAIEKNEEPDATLYDHLGDVYSALHEDQRAHEAWRKSLGIEPNDKIKQKLGAAPST